MDCSRYSCARCKWREGICISVVVNQSFHIKFQLATDLLLVGIFRLFCLVVCSHVALCGQQSKADRIHHDLDELKKALNERSKRLGLEVKASAPTEQSFGA